MPALAVVGADRQIIRSTETFRLKYASSVALCESSPELDLVLTGQTDNAVLDLGGVSLAIEAVTDAAGRRQAVLSLPAEDLDAEAPVAALRAVADESPALVWAKDLEGRYLYANASYERELDTSEERLLGNTDADLPPIETVDGPRLRYIEDGLKEPLQLEYNVPAYDSRPVMVAFRFPLRNSQGQPVATCGVAAPSGTSQVARDEAVRLMKLERLNRLDPLDARAELLEQWHVQAKPGPVGEAEPKLEVTVPVEEVVPIDAPAESAPAESRPEAPEPAASAGAAGAPSPASAETTQLAGESAERVDQLERELQTARERLHSVEAEAQAAAVLAGEESTRLRTELEQARAELEREKREARTARSEVEAARRELGAARAQVKSLRLPADAAVRLSEELERVLAAERKRGDELARTLGRIRARVGDLDSAVERSRAAAPQPS